MHKNRFLMPGQAQFRPAQPVGNLTSTYPGPGCQWLYLYFSLFYYIFLPMNDCQTKKYMVQHGMASVLPGERAKGPSLQREEPFAQMANPLRYSKNN
jgi:hypothetical protein